MYKDYDEDAYSEMGYDDEVKVNGIIIGKNSYDKEDVDDAFDDKMSLEDLLDELAEMGYDTYDEESIKEGLREEFHFNKGKINRLLDEWSDYIEENL